MQGQKVSEGLETLSSRMPSSLEEAVWAGAVEQRCLRSILSLSF